MRFHSNKAFPPRIGCSVSVLARLLTLALLLLHQIISTQAEECPCTHCGPPMCQPLCQLNCLKCCTCCVYFEARIGKRSPYPPRDYHSQWETQGQLDINKREPNKEISLRLSILQKSEGQFRYGGHHTRKIESTQINRGFPDRNLMLLSHVPQRTETMVQNLRDHPLRMASNDALTAAISRRENDLSAMLLQGRSRRDTNGLGEGRKKVGMEEGTMEERALGKNALGEGVVGERESASEIE